MMTSLRNSPSLRQKRSSVVIDIPPADGGGGYVARLKNSKKLKALILKYNFESQVLFSSTKLR